MRSFALVQSSRFSTTDRWSWRITSLAFPMRMSILLFCLPSFVNETPRYLSFSDCFSGTPSIWREHCFGCLDRRMVSVFVVLIFIPATEHASENLSRACWIPFWVESSSTRSSANNKRCKVQSPISTPPQDLLFLTILSIQIWNRIGEREQPCCSPTLTLKGFVVALLTRTQTSECMYSDLIAISNWPSTPYCNSTAQSLSLEMRSFAFLRSTKHALTSFTYSHNFSKDLLQGKDLVHCASAKMKATLCIH